MNLNLDNYGYTPEWQKKAQPDMDKGLMPARVTEAHRDQYRIISQLGESSARLKGLALLHAEQTGSYPVVGDFVMADMDTQGDAVIHALLARTSMFSRQDPRLARQGEQVIAANFDVVFITTSLNHDLNLRRIERYVTAAWQSGASPVIVLTKADLGVGNALYEARQVAPAVPIHAVSALTGEGMASLQPYLMPGKTVIFLGSSGVGKSTLVNHLAGREVMAVNNIRDDDSKGRHTTTHRQLFLLPSGACVIDTPGMRELGMWDVSQGLDEAFADIMELAATCRFRDCTHNREPGCAVHAAIEDGTLTQERYDSWIKLKKEARFQESKSNRLLQQEDRKWQKSLSKYQKQFYNGE